MPTKNAVEPNFLAQARYLRTISDENPDKLEAALQTLGVKKRKAYYLIELDKAFETIAASDAQKLELGWTKLMKMVGYVTPENWAELFKTAKKLPVHDLQKYLEGNYVETPKHCVTLYFFPEEYDTFRVVLKAHGAKELANKSLQAKEPALIKALTKLLPPEKRNR